MAEHKMPPLPECDELFLRFFDPWHDDASRQRRGLKKMSFITGVISQNGPGFLGGGEAAINQKLKLAHSQPKPCGAVASDQVTVFRDRE